MGFIPATVSPMQLEGLSIGQLDALSEAIAQRRQQLVYQDRQRVRTLLIETAQREGYSISELFGFTGKPSPPKEKKPRLQAGLYRNPADPVQTWTGRGRRPEWFQAAIDAGTPAVAMRADG